MLGKKEVGICCNYMINVRDVLSSPTPCGEVCIQKVSLSITETIIRMSVKKYGIISNVCKYKGRLAWYPL